MTKIIDNLNTTTAEYPPLAGLSARKFLNKYWQKKPLLIRGAFKNFSEPFDKGEILQLSKHENVESRLISAEGGKWSVEHGPIDTRTLAKKRKSLWTILVQDTQHFSEKAHALLGMFRFIPYARIDDLMVSFAVPGAGVGPHVDSYDVFLIQGSGQRRWQISAQRDLKLVEGMPLKILDGFCADEEFLLEKGDMLYLPPGYAHNGIAETDCLTWSVGFRAPTQQEWAIAMLDYLRDEIDLHGHYSDPGLLPSRKPGLIDRKMTRKVGKLLQPISREVADTTNQEVCIGRFLTEPKAHVFFDAPSTALSQPAFARKVMKTGAKLDLKTRLLYNHRHCFLNGHEWDVGLSDYRAICKLADYRKLDGTDVANGGATLLTAMYSAYLDGHIHPA